jgi:hypothetical protein
VFFKGSRYEKVATHVLTDASGRAIAYKATRFIPATPALVGHRVTNDERLDHIAWQHYRDAQRFWRICDANLALWPDDLLEEAAVLRVPPVED